MGHPLDLGVLNITQQGSGVHARLEINPEIGARLLQLELKDLTSQQLEVKKNELFSISLGSGQLSFDQMDCQWSEAVQVKIENPQLLSIDVDASCEKIAGQLNLDLPFLKKLEPSYRLLSMIRIDGQEHMAGADPTNSVLNLNINQKKYGFADFIWMGMEHIGASVSEWKNEEGFHIPVGIDHILFVLALLLGGGGFVGLLKTVTGFTLGHSLTLALATLGLVSVPSRLVESAIALSICIVAVESIFIKNSSYRWKVALLFGLIHGLGFASAISGLQLSGTHLVQALIAFNVGVELGQGIIVTCFMPILFILNYYPAAKKLIIPTCASIIFLTGFYWFVQRAFEISIF